MKCSYCGKTIQYDAKYCPYCAEPVPEILSDEDREWEEKELERKAKNRAASSRLPKIFTVNVMIGLGVFLLLFLLQGSLINIKASIAIIVTVSIIILLTIAGYIFCYTHLSNKEIVKYKQFCTDSTSICPMCGSHSIKIYRKGYDYNEAFWGSMFKIKGSRYTAGMNSNDAMCHCQHCGHNWNSGYDYRKIK